MVIWDKKQISNVIFNNVFTIPGTTPFVAIALILMAVNIVCGMVNSISIVILIIIETQLIKGKGEFRGETQGEAPRGRAPLSVVFLQCSFIYDETSIAQQSTHTINLNV